ncbi:protein-disulfide isomerase [Endozoicomonas sp. OPT23]|uniref:DsbC family protein n=1 Tax=Endozoicomonas sp. OPT23 TaxID=2072845 RepID=UPI00129B5CA2|nr:DsbC family protein [Endozoicomonas sp. OPT23]MRI34542.1 protein-disulfide isomerase [Endozoicomonas sp. OPT23]
MVIRTLILTASLLTASNLALAAPAADRTLAEASTAIEKELKALDPNIPIEGIEKTSWDNVYLVKLKGGNLIYASKDGKHLFRGDMLQIGGGQVTNLTEAIRNKTTAAELKKVDPKELINFPAKGKTKGVVYAFTDVDCGYCRKLHQEVPAMNDLGIEVRYLAFPRGGQQSPAYAKMVEAWCSSDRRQSISELKNGQQTVSKKASDEEKAKSQCAALVEKQYQLGLKLGVSGTPAMFLENGQAIPGYRPAADLARIMGITSENDKSKDKPAPKK